MIETIKKVAGKYFKGMITHKGAATVFQFEQFMHHNPAITIGNPQTGFGYKEEFRKTPFTDIISNRGIKQTFASLSVDEIDNMMEELQIIKAEMQK